MLFAHLRSRFFAFSLISLTYMKGKIFGMMAVALLVAVAACSNSAASADSQTSNDSMANQQPDSALTLVKFETSAGDFVVELFNDTPIHRDNFIKLVNEGYYNGVLFHRVINQFMIQTGDPDSKTARPGQRLGAGGPGYTLEAEIHYPQHFHRRYALAAARQGDQVNPERRSSGCQFYIVWGKTYSSGQLGQLEKQLQMQALQGEFNALVGERREQIMQMRRNRDQAGLLALQEELEALAHAAVAQKGLGRMGDEAKRVYSELGGTPFLDGQYTVFGEVEKGLDVVGKIQEVSTDANDRPLKDLKMTMTMVE